MAGGGERFVDLAHVAVPPVKGDVAGPVVPQLRCIGRGGAGHLGRRCLLFVVDDHEFGSIHRCAFANGHDQRHRFAQEANAVADQQRAGGLDGKAAVTLEKPERRGAIGKSVGQPVGTAQHRDDTRMRQRCGSVERPNDPRSLGGPHEDEMQCACMRNVVGISAFADQ